MKCLPDRHLFDDDGVCLRCGASQFDDVDDQPRAVRKFSDKMTKRMPYPRARVRKKDRMSIGGLETTTGWRELKAMVLARPFNGRCEACGTRPPTDAHHRLLTAQGGPDVASNLAALCRQCHDGFHANPQEAQARGFIVRPGPGEPWRNRAVLLWDGGIVTLNDEAGYAFQGFPAELRRCSSSRAIVRGTPHGYRGEPLRGPGNRGPGASTPGPREDPHRGQAKGTYAMVIVASVVALSPVNHRI